MNLVYYKSDIGNVGDDLNPWLWEKIFGDFSDYQSDANFYGIGSLLDSRIDQFSNRIIFGAGVTTLNYDPNIKETDDIVFLRGPISSKVFNNAEYIADAAYCLGLLDMPKYEKKYECAYMPYFRQLSGIDLALLENSNMKIILPTSPVEQVIQEICESKKIFASAMHGAILADVLRVPWMRVRTPRQGFEAPLMTELKWADWHMAIGFNEIPTLDINLGLSETNSFLYRKFKTIYLKNKLKNNKLPFFLSEESKYNACLDLLRLKVEYLKTKYKQAK